jgi:hypothetical protein
MALDPDDDVLAMVNSMMARFPRGASRAKQARWAAAFFYGLLREAQKMEAQPVVDAIQAGIEDMPDDVRQAFDAIRARIQ